MLKQIKCLFSELATVAIIVSVCLLIWAVVGVCVGFGLSVGKQLAGVI